MDGFSPHASIRPLSVTLWFEPTEPSSCRLYTIFPNEGERSFTWASRASMAWVQEEGERGLKDQMVLLKLFRMNLRFEVSVQIAKTAYAFSGCCEGA